MPGVRPLQTNTYQVKPRSKLFQRSTTGYSLVTLTTFEGALFKVVFGCDLNMTWMCRKKVHAILEWAHSINFSRQVEPRTLLGCVNFLKASGANAEEGHGSTWRCEHILDADRARSGVCCSAASINVAHSDLLAMTATFMG
jgi:hypothetical protein